MLSFPGVGSILPRRIFTGATFMARPGLETSHTWGLTSSKKATDSSFSTANCKYSDTRQRNLLASSFPQVTLVWRCQRRSLPHRGAGQPGMYKKGWVPCQLPTLQWRDLVKVQLWGFPSTPITILVRESKGPNWKGRTEKAAPMSRRKFTSLPSRSRVTQG